MLKEKLPSELKHLKRELETLNDILQTIAEYGLCPEIFGVKIESHCKTSDKYLCPVDERRACWEKAIFTWLTHSKYLNYDMRIMWANLIEVLGNLRHTDSCPGKNGFCDEYVHNEAFCMYPKGKHACSDCWEKAILLRLESEG